VAWQQERERAERDSAELAEHLSQTADSDHD
jgi:hypothetical protein